MTPDYSFWLGEDAEYCVDLETDPTAFGLVIDATGEPALFDE